MAQILLQDHTHFGFVCWFSMKYEKQYGLHKLEKNTATNDNEKIYSDHNCILINLDFETPTEDPGH